MILRFISCCLMLLLVCTGIGMIYRKRKEMLTSTSSDSSAAGEEADEAQDSNANAQDADFDASTLFRYAHARRFHLLRCCFYLVRCCFDLFLLLAGRVAACRLSHRLRLPFCRTRGGTQARRQLIVSMTSRCHPHTLTHSHTSSLVGSG